MTPGVHKLSFDGIAGESTYYVVVVPNGQGKTFNGLLQGGLPFPRLRAYLYWWTHRSGS